MRDGAIAPAAIAELQRLLDETKRDQLRLLKRIYAVFWFLLALCLAAVFVLSPFLAPEALELLAGPVELGLLAACLSLSILGAVLVRLLLLSPGRVLRGGKRLLERWRMPDSVPEPVARRTVYLGRFSAGMLVGWVCALAPALYGLLARLMGFGAWITAACLALAAGLMLWLLPSAKRLDAALDSLGEDGPS
ncbi:MAG: hypothetical protein D6806_16740 [Deltaproteobacteria bacterium]|nr:MAG: hypothetical protein D6806_16740 [Deltaproteobacteria bacterium]